MGFSRQEYWTGLPFPSPGDLPHPGIELRSPTLQADALTSEPPVCMLSKFSSVQLFETLWTIAHQALLSMEFSRQEYWSEFHSLLQGISPTQGSNPSLLCLLHCRQILYHWATGKAHSFFTENKISREPWLLPLLPSRHQNSPWKLLLMLLYQHLFHLSIIFHFHKLLLPHTWILELHFPPIPVFSFSSKHSILLPDQFS